jgi:hypothetical protein
MCDHPIRNSFTECRKDSSYCPHLPRIGHRTSKDFTPARPFKPTKSRAQPLAAAAAVLAQIGRGAANSAHHQPESASCIRPDSAAHGRPEKSLRSRRHRENMPEKLTAGRLASDAPRCCTEADQHILTRGRGRDSALRGQPRFAIYRCRSRLNGRSFLATIGNPGGMSAKAPLSEAQCPSQGAHGHLSMPIAINLGQAPNRLSI